MIEPITDIFTPDDFMLDPGNAKAVARRANDVFRNYMGQMLGPKVYGDCLTTRPDLWSEEKNNNHRAEAYLFNVQEIEKRPECEISGKHEATQHWVGNIFQKHVCKHCNRKLVAEWKVAE